jgi:phage/plasmid primase-like uncharacterized protein|nr:MAG: DNA primase [Leptospirillum sp. Group II '5-way CG']
MRSPCFGGAGTENLDWSSIFASFEIDVPANPRRHGPCPVCGGKDRFRFDDRNGSGSWFCNQGDLHPLGKQAGDGFALVADFFNIGYREAATKVREVSGEPVRSTDRKNPRPLTLDKQNQEKISRILKNSVRLDEIDKNSRHMLLSGKIAVQKYLQSRELPELLPAEARLAVCPDGYDLIVPLTSDREVPSLHITSLTADGSKRPLSWTGGSCRYTMGPLSGSYSSLPGADEQISVPGFPGVRFYALGEGLETVISGRLLTGWPSIFAVNANGIKSFLDCKDTLAIFQNSGFGLAILVDRDKSGAGQKAGASLARRAKEAGIPVLFLVPPALVKGGAKSADWNDALVELGEEGAKAALSLAMQRSEEELSKVEGGQILPIDKSRETDTAPVLANRIQLGESTISTRVLVRNFLDGREDAPTLAEIATGTGKSRILGDLSRDHLYLGDPLVTVTPTKSLSAEASGKSGGLFREGRTDDPIRAGHCLMYPEVVPYAEAWRSIVAHKCASCVHGLAAMAVSRGEMPETAPCAYILHVQDSRQSPVVATTAAMLEGDPNLTSTRSGERRKVILDDCGELSDHRSVHGGHVSSWIRAANHSIRLDQAKIAAGETADGDASRQERIEATRSLLPHLEALSRLLSDHPSEDQTRIGPESWTEFSKLVKSSELKWLDGTSAEAIYRDIEGKVEIPLRTLKVLGEAIERGTAWVRKSILHFATGTEAFRAIRNGALILDATPSLAVKSVVEALGGTRTAIYTEQPSLRNRLIVSGNHGKTACSPDSPSFARERIHFLNTVKDLSSLQDAKNVAILSHKAFVDTLDALPEIEIGHWGLHDRGHNDWQEKTALLIWGVPQLSPSSAERQYQADRQAVIEAGGEPWPKWNGARTERWYQIPGQFKEIHAAGYEDEFIDLWHREWTTARLVQAIGRLRAVRRTDEPLEVIIHATFPFSQSFGLEFHTVERPDWRVMRDYQMKRKAIQIEKGIIAFHSTGGKSRRNANSWLKEHGMEGISNNDWPEIMKSASGLRHEYSSFASKTTPDIFGKDVHLLIEALDRLEAYALGDGMTLRDLAAEGLVDPDPLERIALEILRASVKAESRAGPFGSGETRAMVIGDSRNASVASARVSGS